MRQAVYLFASQYDTNTPKPPLFQQAEEIYR